MLEAKLSQTVWLDTTGAKQFVDVRLKQLAVSSVFGSRQNHMLEDELLAAQASF